MAEEAAFVAQEFVSSLDNLPSEVAFLLNEIQQKDAIYQELTTRLSSRTSSHLKHIRPSSALNASISNPSAPYVATTINPATSKESNQTLPKIAAEFDRLAALQRDKVALAEKLVGGVNKHARRLELEVLGRVAELGGVEVPKVDRDAVLGPFADKKGDSSNKKRRLNLPPVPMPAPYVMASTFPTSTSSQGGRQTPSMAPPTSVPAHLFAHPQHASHPGATATAGSAAGSAGQTRSPATSAAQHPTYIPANSAYVSQMPPPIAPSRGGTAHANQHTASATAAAASAAAAAAAPASAPGGSSAQKTAGSAKKRKSKAVEVDSEDDAFGEDDAQGEPEEEVEGAEEGAGDDETLYCYCKQKSFGEMVGCDNDKCEIEWFHIKCVNLTPPLPETWFCPTCTALGAGRKRGGGRK